MTIFDDIGQNLILNLQTFSVDDVNIVTSVTAKSSLDLTWVKHLWRPRQYAILVDQVVIQVNKGLPVLESFKNRCFKPAIRQ